MRVLLFIAVLALLTASLFAGGAENKNNFSAGYARILSKNTETSKPDAVFYNPAGTAFMEDGLYVEAANQFLFKEYSNDADDLHADLDKYKSDNPTLLYPSAELVWKKDNYAVFGAIGVYAGGGKLEYDDGTYTSTAAMLNFKAKVAEISLPAAALVETDNSFEAYSATFGYTLGGSYAFNDMVSVSLAGRMLSGKQTMKAKLDEEPNASLAAFGLDSQTLIDTEASATGFGAIFGIHIKPIEKLDIALQYQTITKMEYEYDKVKGATFMTGANGLDIEKGDKFDQDLPAVFAMGVGYQILPALYASTSFNYYFNDQADMIYDDSWEIALGAEYAINEMIAVSAGGMYSKQGFKDSKNSTENPLLDSVTIGLGAGLNFIENLTVDIGLMKPFYFDTDYETALGDVSISKKLTILAIGATYRF